MAKLPTRDSLGPLPSARSGRHIPTIDERIIAAPGRAMASLGKEIANLGATLAEADDRAQQFETERRFQEFEFEQSKALDEAMRSVEPGQVQTFADDWQKTYVERAREFFNTIPDRYKPRYDAKLFGTERQLYGAASTFARKEQARFFEVELADHKNRLAKEEPDIQRARERYDELLRKNPYLSPIQKDIIRRKHLEDLEEQNAEWRYWRGDKSVIEDIERALPPSADPAAGLTAPKGQSVEGRFFAPGLDIEDGVDPAAPYMRRQRPETNIRRIIVHGDVNESAEDLLEYGRRVDKERGFDPNYHFYIARDGRIIQGVPLDRTANHALRENRDTIGIVLAGADDGRMPTPEQEASAKKLISSLGKTYGIDPKDVMGHGELQPGRRHAEEGGRVAADIRKHGFVPDGATPGENQQVAEASGRARLPGAPSSPYQFLSPERQRALLNRLRVAHSAETQQEIKDDIERLRNTGREKLDADGLTALERAKREKSLLPNQITALELAREEARSEWEAVSPLKGMSPEEAEAHLARLAPNPEDENYAIRDKVFDKARRTWSAILEERRKDPVRAVSEAPEVRGALEIIRHRMPGVVLEQDEEGNLALGEAEGLPDARTPVTVGGRQYQVQNEVQQAQWKAAEMLIEARLEAQRRLGIPEWGQKPITRSEAQRLLNMADPRDLDEKTYLDKLREASDRAEQIYGPRYARRVFESAISFTTRDKEHKDIAASVIAKMARGEPVTRRDFEVLRSLDEIDAMGRMFEAPLPEYAYQGERPFISPEFARGPVADITRYAGREVNRKPNQQQIDWVLQDPAARQPIFDQLFGRGAWARVQSQIGASGQR